MTRGGGGGSAGGGRSSAKVAWDAPEPKFIRELKEKVGYKEPEGVEAKHRRAEGGEDREDRDDEAPTVVVLRKGDLTEEEAKVEAPEKPDGDGPPADGKIRFKKPKRRSEEEEKRMDHTGEPDRKRGKVHKKSMLSFNEDEEDE
jgi:hypothetical protein